MKSLDTIQPFYVMELLARAKALELPGLGFGIPVIPQGAFYIYADCSQWTDDSFEFSWRLLEKAHVAVTPGKDFGLNQPQRHLRFAYTASVERLAEGVKRIPFLGSP